MAAHGLEAEQYLQRLVEGNRNFAGGYLYFPNRGIDRRRAVVKGQQPIAAVLSCSDSRVPPELIFGHGLGDLFVVRNAGQVVDDTTLGSLEYGVEQLGIGLVIVLGHQGCGAVTAALQELAGPGYAAPGHISDLLRFVRPAVEAAQARSSKEDLLQNAILANVRYAVGRLSAAEPILKKAVQEGRVKVVGAFYNLETGLVEWIN